MAGTADASGGGRDSRSALQLSSGCVEVFAACRYLRSALPEHRRCGSERPHPTHGRYVAPLVTTKSAEVTASLDQQFSRFREALDGRTQTLNDALGARVVDIAKTLADGGKEVVGALDKRISDVTAVINVRGAKLADALGAKIDDIDQAFGKRALELATNIDSRISRFEELLIGRAETVTKDIEVRSKAAADTIAARVEQD